MKSSQNILFQEAIDKHTVVNLKRIFRIIAFTCISLLLVSCSLIKKTKPTDKLMDGMTYLEGGQFTKGSGFILQLDPKKDSTLLYNEAVNRTTVKAFYLSDHEVTNGEYMQFVHWVRDSIMRCLLFDGAAENEKAKWGSFITVNPSKHDSIYLRFKLNWETSLDYNNPEVRETLMNAFQIDYSFELQALINDPRKLLFMSNNYFDKETQESYTNITAIYPDTMCWQKESEFYNSQENYFWHPAYKDYPVVGLTYEQVTAYCKWKTEEYKRILNKLSDRDRAKMPQNATFRLPTEKEWEFAATSLKDVEGDISWEISGYQKYTDGYHSNFGKSQLKSGIIMKNHFDDGCFFTSKIKSYAPNSYGIYDLYGNVSEWVQDEPKEPVFSLTRNTDFDSHKSIFSNSLSQDLLFITDPYTKHTHLVKKFSSEHKRLVDLRMKFYQIDPEDSEEVIRDKYYAFNSIDSMYYDSVDLLNPITTIREVKNTIDGIEEIKNIYQDNQPMFYNNIDGWFRPIHSFRPELDKSEEVRLSYKIECYKHNLAVLNRAYDYGRELYPESYLNMARIVKGGSWEDEAHYLIASSTQVLNHLEASCKVGFRVAMDIPEGYQLTHSDKLRLKKLKKLKAKAEDRWGSIL
jgi:formylglycine-generating enzyme required for sulfatase activity